MVRAFRRVPLVENLEGNYLLPSLQTLRVFGISRPDKKHHHAAGDSTAPPWQAVHGSDPDLAKLALVSLAEVVRETASHVEFTGLGEACPEWRTLVTPLLEGAVGEVAGDQPCSVLGRGSARVLQVREGMGEVFLFFLFCVKYIK